MSGQADSVKSIFYALGANTAIAIAKSIAAFVTGSGSMMAESVHSFADCGNQLLLLLGIKQAKKPPSPDSPLGYGKEVYFWSFIVALMLFCMGGLFSIYEGVHKLQHPEPITYPMVAVGVLAFAILAEGISLYACVQEINKSRGSKSLWQWFRQTRQSELLVVFGEDIAALLGLAFALVAVLLTMLTGNPVYDALGSIVIGLLLVLIAVLLGREVKALLIGQGVELDTRTQMRGFLESHDEVAELFNLLTLQLGDDVMVAVKARMEEGESSHELIASINRCEADFKKQFPQVMWLFFEPDIKD